MKITPHIQKQLDEIELNPNHSTESIFLAGMKYKGQDVFPASLMGALIMLMIFYCLSAVFHVKTQSEYEQIILERKNEMTDDLFYKNKAMNDSAMKHVNEPAIYNRFIDSANKYYEIQHYILNHK